jgi:sugar (pentulose or hexulose) kinase
MLEKFGKLIEGKYPWNIADILPKVLPAGVSAGTLIRPELVDPSGTLKKGILLCPPEGDAGTGMVATNAVTVGTGNVSAGTSVFAMIVMDKTLSAVYPEIDITATPAGKPVAMVHCNNCTSDLDAWIKLFMEVNAAFNTKVDKGAFYDTLYFKALEGDADCGGLLSYNYFSGEHITGFEEGRPLLVRKSDAVFSLPNFMRTLLYSTVSSLRLGMNILTEKEKIHIDCIVGHGGLFKTKGVGQRFMAASLNVPVAVMESAGEGGAWGIALLAAFLSAGGGTLEDFLAKKVFAKNAGSRVEPDPADVAGFNRYLERYTAGLAVERAAVAALV